MIYISAQPDRYYFLWQLKLQMFNFSRLGIPKKDIHVLIGFCPKKGLSQMFSDFINENDQANFYCYPDTRRRSFYESSLRPHLLKKHFDKYNWLATETIFYHDSDVIFTRKPDLYRFLDDRSWYASRTGSYNDSGYIKGRIGNENFETMCRIVGVRASQVEENDPMTGGAQYILKEVTSSFWATVEKKSEQMYEFLYNLNKNISPIKKDRENIQEWCTDMWCVWWEGLRQGRVLKVDADLDFYWASSRSQDIQEKLILHYSGNISSSVDHFFRKGKYVYFSPFYDDLSKIDSGSASKFIVNEINLYNREESKKRINLNKLSILIPVRIDSEERLENLRLVTSYLALNFNCEIIVLEADRSPKVDKNDLPREIIYHFIRDEKESFHHTRYNNRLLSMSTKPYIAFYDTDVVLTIQQIADAYYSLESDTADVVYPYDGVFVAVDSLLKKMFGKAMDINFLVRNERKLTIATKRSVGGCVLMDKRKYLEAGGDNENFSSWGPEDLERWKRMKVLGYRISRIPGSIFHLPHPRNADSGYRSIDQRYVLFEEYIRICSMSPARLRKYIESWTWLKK